MEDYFNNASFYHVSTPERKSGNEHFAVDDLLDFSNEDDNKKFSGNVEDGLFDFVGNGDSTESSPTFTALDSCSNAFSGELMCQSFADASLAGDLSEPYDELAELEWLSNFVEESFSTEELNKYKLLNPSKSSSMAVTESSVFASEAPVPGKARSKRSRAAPGTWSSRLLVVSPSSAMMSELINLTTIQATSPRKPLKKKEPAVIFPEMVNGDGRRCVHCQTDKTPQWRTGPMGPKTLCNACGVRYKSGRLVPEYRPAASPSFVLSKHSNSHRKVLELRRQKEMQQQQKQRMMSGGGGGGSGVGGLYDVAVAGDNFLVHHRLGPDFRQLI